MASYITLYPISAFDAALPALASIDSGEKASLINDAFEAILSYLGWGGSTLLSTRYKEQLDGLDGPTVLVTMAPVTTIHNVWLDTLRTFNEAPPETTDTDYLVDPEGYRVDRSGWGIVRSKTVTSTANLITGGWVGFTIAGATGRLNAGHYGWPNGKGVVWADYTGGYTATTLPGAIKSAAKELIAYGYRVSRQGGFVATSTRYQDVTQSYGLLAEAFQNNGSLMNARNLLNKAGLVRPVSYAIPAFP